MTVSIRYDMHLRLGIILNNNTMKDTLRLLITWECNLKCTYCCNEIPSVREGIEEIVFVDYVASLKNYSILCVSGGEPFLDKKLLFRTE